MTDAVELCNHLVDNEIADLNIRIKEMEQDKIK